MARGASVCADAVLMCNGRCHPGTALTFIEVIPVHTQTFGAKLRSLDAVLFLISLALSYFLAVSLFGSSDAITIKQTIPILVIITCIVNSIYIVLRIIPGSTLLSLGPNNLMITQLWISKNIGYDETLSIKVLNGQQSRGLLTKKAISLALKSGKRMTTPDCYDISKERLSAEIQSRRGLIVANRILPH